MDWLSLSSIGPSGLAAVCVLMILTGRLVPGKERDYWRKAFFEEQEMRRELQATGTVTRKVLTALTPPGDGE